MIGLADGHVGRGLAHGQRVVRPAKVVVNRQVAGRHVGKVLQQPQRRHLRHAIGGPAGKLEAARLVDALQNSLGELVGERHHVIGAKSDAGPQSDRFGPAPTRRRPIASSAAATPIWHSRHITFSPLRMALVCSLSKRAEVLDLAAELPGLGGKGHRKRAVGKRRERPTPLRPARSKVPKLCLAAAQRADDAHPRDDDSALATIMGVPFNTGRDDRAGIAIRRATTAPGARGNQIALPLDQYQHSARGGIPEAAGSPGISECAVNARPASAPSPGSPAGPGRPASGNARGTGSARSAAVRSAPAAAAPRPWARRPSPGTAFPPGRCRT